MEDTVVVESDNAILVAKMQAHQTVKEVVEELKKKARSEIENHRKVYRPWGFYDSLNSGPHHQVKKIVVKPGGVLSLQYHHHRAEHWIVVAGTAKNHPINHPAAEGDPTYQCAKQAWSN